MRLHSTSVYVQCFQNRAGLSTREAYHARNYFSIRGRMSAYVARNTSQFRWLQCLGAQRLFLLLRLLDNGVPGDKYAAFHLSNP